MLTILRGSTPLIIGVVLLGTIGTGPAGHVRPASVDRSRPNIVVVLSDDQTVEQMRFLPKTRELIGDRGVTFPTSYVANPVCCPSRVSLLTGQYPHNHGVWSNDTATGGGFQAFRHQDRTLPVALERAGYTTAYVGKYLNGYGLEAPQQVPPGWNEWWGSVDPSSYRSYGFTLNHNGRLKTFPETPAGYQSDVYARLAARFIRSQRDADEPFFLVVAPAQPHVTRPDGGACSVQCALGPPMPLAVPPPRHNGKYENATLAASPSYAEPDLSDKSTYTTGHRNARPTPFAADVQRDIERAYRAEADSLAGVDDLVATVDRALGATGARATTDVIFTSDNGAMHGEHGLVGGKEMPYEESTRVPLLVRGPGVAAGREASAPTVNVDLAPTILELAGADPPRVPDGRSLVPILEDPSRAWDRPILVEAKYPRPGGFRVLRDGDMVLIRWGDGQRELYDLAADPFELENLADDPMRSQILASLDATLDVLAECIGASCRSAAGR